MKRRDFLFAGALLASSVSHAIAQQPAMKKRFAAIVYRIDEFRIGGDPLATAFLEELQRLGYVEGGNLIIERWQYQSGRLDEIARKVVATNPDVIASPGTPMTLSLKAATRTIPIVAITGDPVRFGLLSNLARPGGNITGVSVDAGVEVWAKRLELLSSAVPKLINVAFISSDATGTGAGGETVRDAAQKLGISLVRVSLRSPYAEAEYRSAFASIQREQVDGLIFSDEGHVLLPQRSLLVQLVRELRLPAIFPYRDFAEAGGLMSYSSDLRDVLLRLAGQIVEVLRGANPGDIPYSQAVRFDLVVNLKTAKELGIEIPAELVAGAAAVIE
jgi:putative ABC transport system substrate-binding protein